MDYSITNLNDLNDDEYERFLSMMDASRQSRIARYANESDKRRSVLGEKLAKELLSKVSGRAVEDIVISEEAGKKPISNVKGFDFSISHSGSYVGCAVCDRPIGFDIEEIRPIKLTAAKRICTPADLDYIYDSGTPCFDRCEDRETLARFFEIWTKKEAYIKYLGIGLAAIDEVLPSDILTFRFENAVASIKV